MANLSDRSFPPTNLGHEDEEMLPTGWGYHNGTQRGAFSHADNQRDVHPGSRAQVNIGIVQLNVQIREFEKPWLFHVLPDLEHPCILGVDFISGPKIVLDFDRKSLAIPDSQIDKVVKTIEEGKEIDTGGNPPVVCRLYRYDRVKQAILDYHVDKMLKEGTIIPIQSPSPGVFKRYVSSHIVESGTIKPSPTKTLAVRKFPEPTTIKQVQSFLGLTGYFRKVHQRLFKDS
ncbi:uncharacterized protein TNCV_4204651 [Trichonephila clavipes]|nr:uncharacterized protein TNCV_4204651 [Trichonephila clavipes]